METLSYDDFKKEAEKLAKKKKRTPKVRILNLLALFLGIVASVLLINYLRHTGISNHNIGCIVPVFMFIYTVTVMVINVVFSLPVKATEDEVKEFLPQLLAEKEQELSEEVSRCEEYLESFEEEIAEAKVNIQKEKENLQKAKETLEDFQRQFSNK